MVGQLAHMVQPELDGNLQKMIYLYFIIQVVEYTEVLIMASLVH
jgi:hypothetical protein